MQLIPFQNVRQGTSRKLSSYHALLDSNRDFGLAVESVEVRRLVVPVEHGDHDSKEAANLRHGYILPHYLVVKRDVGNFGKLSSLGPQFEPA